MTRIDTNKKRALLVVASLVAALCLAEVIARTAAPPPVSLRFKQDLTELRGMRLHTAASIVENDPELFWRLSPNKRLPPDNWPFFGLISNSQSLREDHEILENKAPGEVRILFLGDSRTFGYGVDYDKSFPYLTELLLQAQLTNRNVECVNAGVPGYSVFQGLRFLKTRGMELTPDLIVLNFGWNDQSEWDNRSDIEHYNMMRKTTPPAPLDRSRVCQLIWVLRGLRSKEPASRKSRPRLSDDEGLICLKQIQTMANKKGIAIIMLLWPARDEIENKPALPATPANSMALELTPAILAAVKDQGIDNVYLDNGHVTELGHAAIAQAIAAKVTFWLDAEGLR